jgi:cardiolipin synthase
VNLRWPAAIAAALLARYASESLRHRREGGRGYVIEDRPEVGSEGFTRAAEALTQAPISRGNRSEILINGDRIFPSMLGAIASARHTVDLLTYIYWRGQMGDRFGDAICERAEAGVSCRVLLDAVGSVKMDPALIKRMKDCGARVYRFRPPKPYAIRRGNNRTHRKLLVVDGRIGFTGGIGIADLYRGHAQDQEHWRDSQFRIEGPAVSEMQAVFLDNWIETGNPLLDGPAYFPVLDSVGPELAQTVLSSPGGGTEGLHLMFLLAIASAERSIRIANAYFVPNTIAVEMLVAARRRGVNVEIIVPGPVNDAKLVERASRAKWGPLLEAGVKIYEYQPTMYHTKVTLVDDYWVSVGSTNFDNRSFRLNDEANLNVLDDGFGRAQAEVFAQDRTRAREVTLEEWRHRPVTERLEELVGRMMRHQL